MTSWRPLASAVPAVAVLLAGCLPDEPGFENRRPVTFFDPAPADTSYHGDLFFRWLGTDLDSEIIAYQHQLVETDSAWFASGGQAGVVLRSVDPPAAGDQPIWSAHHSDRFLSYPQLGYGRYELRVQSVDDQGAVDEVPAVARFVVFFDIVAPVPQIVNADECGLLPAGTVSHVFRVSATDLRGYDPVPREQLQFSVRLRATTPATCNTHLNDPFDSPTDLLDGVDDGWGPFPSGFSDPLPIAYTDLNSPNCTWEFALRVRDPAGNEAHATCGISTP